MYEKLAIQKKSRNYDYREVEVTRNLTLIDSKIKQQKSRCKNNKQHVSDRHSRSKQITFSATLLNDEESINKDLKNKVKKKKKTYSVLHWNCKLSINLSGL